MANIPAGFELVESNIPQGFELVGQPIEQPIQQVAEPTRPSSLTANPVASLIGEPALTIATGILAEPLAGLAGIGALLPGGRTPTEAIEQTREALTFQPRTSLGQKGLEAVGTVFEPIGEAFKFAEEKLGGAGAAIAGPVGGAIGATIPTAIGSLIGVRAVPKTSALKAPSPENIKIAELIQKGSADISTAKFKAVEGIAAQQTVLQKALNIGAPKIVKDKAAISAIKQGFDEGVIAAIKGSAKQDKQSMLSMLGILEKGKKNAAFAVTNRPTDIVGNALLKRLNIVRGANKLAGSSLEKVAKSLKGKEVDSIQAVNNFNEALDNIGVSLSRNSKGVVTPRFKGSDIEGLAGPEAAIKRVVKRMAGSKAPDAFELHRLKKFIDEQVSFGKTAEGLTGKTENILKSLRRDLDGVLDKNFPAYDKVNTKYADTISAIDAFQKAAGKSINLSVDSSNKAIGTVMRRIMGNTQSRLNLLDSIDEIERAAKKYGGKNVPKDDLLSLILFADELDSVFGATARTSFKGQIDQAIKAGAKGVTSPTEAGLSVAGKIAEKVGGVSEQKAITAIRELLKDSVNKP